MFIVLGVCIFVLGFCVGSLFILETRTKDASNGWKATLEELKRCDDLGDGFTGELEGLKRENERLNDIVKGSKNAKK